MAKERLVVDVLEERIGFAGDPGAATRTDRGERRDAVNDAVVMTPAAARHFAKVY